MNIKIKTLLVICFLFFLIRNQIWEHRSVLVLMLPIQTRAGCRKKEKTITTVPKVGPPPKFNAGCDESVNLFLRIPSSSRAFRPIHTIRIRYVNVGKWTQSTAHSHLPLLQVGPPKAQASKSQHNNCRWPATWDVEPTFTESHSNLRWVYFHNERILWWSHGEGNFRCLLLCCLVQHSGMRKRKRVNWFSLRKRILIFFHRCKKTTILITMKIKIENKNWTGADLENFSQRGHYIK